MRAGLSGAVDIVNADADVEVEVDVDVDRREN